MHYSDFIDLKSMRAIRNPKLNDRGEKVNWLKICVFRYMREEDHVLYEYSFSEDFKKILLRKTSTRNSAQTPTALEETPLYCQPLLISESKKKDLLELCSKGYIPDEYHSFYHNLGCCREMNDAIPQTEPETEF